MSERLNTYRTVQVREIVGDSLVVTPFTFIDDLLLRANVNTGMHRIYKRFYKENRRNKRVNLFKKHPVKSPKKNLCFPAFLMFYVVENRWIPDVK